MLARDAWFCKNYVIWTKARRNHEASFRCTTQVRLRQDTAAARYHRGAPASRHLPFARRKRCGRTWGESPKLGASSLRQGTALKSAEPRRLGQAALACAAAGP